MKGFLRDFFNLFKYELLSSAKSLLFAYVLGMVCFCLVIIVPDRNNIVLFSSFDWLELVVGFTSVASFAAFFVILVLRVFHTFWREIFGAQGYLTLTLPVSLDAILLSKIFTYTFWIVAGIILGQFIVMFVDNGRNVSPKTFVDSFVFYHTISTIFWICFILFITALLNALQVRSFVFIKGFLLALVIFIIKKILGFSIIISDFEQNAFMIWFDNSSLSLLLDVVFSILFYLGARFLIIYKLELE